VTRWPRAAATQAEANPLPRVLERIFTEAGRSVHDYMDLRRLDPQWRCFFDDGSRVDLIEDVVGPISKRKPPSCSTAALPPIQSFLS
jgi:phytoene dehydrogenase-like protein